MGSRVIKAIPNEIVLYIAEYMDIITCKCFMATSKGVFMLIKSNEYSISKNRAATFALPPLGDLLSSSTDERHVLPKNTFSMIHELELRDHRIDRLIKECPKIFCIASSPWLPPLTVLGQTRLVPILKRALRQCDRIADIAAKESPIPQVYYRSIPDGAYELPSTLLSSELNKFNPLANPNARPKQIEYIRSLSLEDIGGLFILVNMLGYELMLSYPLSPTSHERKTVIEECILRHGTWFVWARLLGGPDMLELAGHIISAGRAELRQWESGALSGPDGLKMTLMGRFRQLIGGGPTGEFAEKIVDTLEKLVIGDEKGSINWEFDSDDEE